MMVHVVLLQSHDEWEQHRHTFLQRGLYHAYMQYKHGRSALTAPVSSSSSSRALSPDLAPMDSKSDDTSREDTESSKTSENYFAIVQLNAYIYRTHITAATFLKRLQIILSSPFFKPDNTHNQWQSYFLS
jgi:hypothetical protein